MTVFHDYGLEFARSDVHEAAERIRASSIRLRLTAALDDWAALEKDQQRHASLIAFVHQADDDPWRIQLRDAMERKNMEELSNLAESDQLLTQSPVTILLLGKILNDDLQRADLSVKMLRHALLVYPTDFWINTELGLIVQNSRPNQSVGYLQTALAQHPDSSAVRLVLGLALSQSGRFGPAEEEVRTVFRLNPDWRWPTATWVSCLRRKVVWTTRRKNSEMRFTGQPNSANVRLWFGDFCQRQKKWPEAIATFEEAIVREPTFAECYVKLARFLSKGPIAYRNPQRTVEVATKATDLLPQSSMAWQELGWAQYRASAWQASIDALEKSDSLETDPGGGNSGQWALLAMTHWHLDHKEEARKWFQQAHRDFANYGTASDEVRCAFGEAAELLGERLNPDEFVLVARGRGKSTVGSSRYLFCPGH